MRSFKKPDADDRHFHLEKWDHLPKAVNTIRKAAGARAGRRERLLFRGLPDASFLLQSSLERSLLANDGCTKVSQYLNHIEEIRPSVESLRNMSLDEVPTDNPNKFFDYRGSWYSHYSYLIYLRHHGFPSPLLDWTASPYVAAYFAFRVERSKWVKHGSDDVVIYAFAEAPKRGKVWTSNDPHVRELGPRINAHLRHMRQQSAYTICLQEDGDMWFVPYPDELTSTTRATDQDVFWKVTLPYSERAKALAELDLMNVNAYSLFDSDEALMETLYNRCARRL